MRLCQDIVRSVIDGHAGVGDGHEIVVYGVIAFELDSYLIGCRCQCFAAVGCDADTC